MSVLSFPRIYFQGWLEWDPCTFNNNDFGNSPNYDAGRASLNWDFLGATGPSGGITPENFQETLRPWMRTYSSAINAVPAEWNTFGSHSVRFLQNGGKQATLVTGGATGPSGPTGPLSDGIIGGMVTLRGDEGTPAVLVDTNPSSFWSSQIYWGSITIGSGDAAISGKRAYRMHSRWLNLSRIYATGNLSGPAAGVGCCFQTGIPFDEVLWPEPGVSTLADDLKAAASAPGAQGIMVRFTAYVNLYFQNGILNSIATRPRNYTALAADLETAWKAWEDSGGTDTSLFFANPCYSHVVGVAGVWNDGELASAPGGRYLVPQNVIAPLGLTGPTGARIAVAAVANDTSKIGEMSKIERGSHAGPIRLVAGVPAASLTPTILGPVVAEVNGNVLSLDLNSAIPEIGSGEMLYDLQKANFGPLSVGVLGATGAFTSLGEITYDQYSTSSYQATAGIVDLPLSSTGPLSGTLAIQAQGVIALQEEPWTAQTDMRGIYLDEGGTTSFQVQVCQQGVPAPNASLLVARYGPSWQLPVNYGSLSVVPVGPTAPTGPIAPTGPTGATAPAGSPPEQVVDFVGGTTSTLQVGGPSGPFTEVNLVNTDANGMATVTVSAQTPGVMVLGFFPGASGPAVPPPAAINPPYPTGPTGLPVAPFNTTIDAWYYTTVRVLPFDDDLPQQFCDLWNSTHDQDLAWDFIYSPTSPGGGILYLYDMVFSVMLEHLPLGNKSAVETSATQMWAMISPNSASEGSYVMPITRDLSAGKRLVLQLWIYLVINGYPTSPPLTVNSIDGWSPIS